MLGLFTDNGKENGNYWSDLQFASGRAGFNCRVGFNMRRFNQAREDLECQGSSLHCGQT